MSHLNPWVIFFNLLYVMGGLGIFLYGMRIMSEAIQKVAGDGMRRIMASMTRNRYFGLATGLFVTCLVQSSSATTVMVVSFVNAQLLTLTESIGVIMGANLGTTLTGWIIGLVGKFSLSKVALPLIGLAFVLVFSKNEKIKHFGEFLIGFGLLFFGLSLLKDSVPDVKSLLFSEDPNDIALVGEIQSIIKNLNSFGFGSVLIFVVIGVFLTILVQSSSAAMGITIILSANGWISFEIAAAIVMGENIGTTITAWLSSIGTSLSARRAAKAHLIFNLTGVCWMLILFYPFLNLVDYLWAGPIHIEDVTMEQVLADPAIADLELEGQPNDQDIANAKKGIVDANIPLHLALFHTLFNLTNIALLIGFTPQLGRLVERFVKPKPGEGNAEAKPGSLASIEFAGTGMLPKTGELNLTIVEAELTRLANVSRYMFESFVEAFESPEEKKLSLIKELESLEKKCDQFAFDITQALVRFSTQELAGSQAVRVSCLLRVTGDLEDVGDSCNRLAQLALLKYRNESSLPEDILREIKQLSLLIMELMDLYQERIHEDGNPPDLTVAKAIGDRIESSRKLLRKNALKSVKVMESKNGAEVYLDVLNEMDRISEDALNVVQALNHVID